MSLGSRQMAHLLRNLGYLIFHHLLVSGHSFEFSSQLTDRLIQRLISLGLDRYEALYKTLQIGFGMG